MTCSPQSFTPREESIFLLNLCERILCRVRQALRLVVTDLAHINADILEYFIQRFAEMTECNCAVVRVILLNQYVTIKSSHLRDREPKFMGGMRWSLLKNI